MKNHRSINGRIGGLLVFARYGRDHYVEMGRKGGRPTVQAANESNTEWDSKRWRGFMRRLEV